MTMLMHTLLTTCSILVIGTVFGQAGTLDPDFDMGTGPNSDVKAIAIQSDGKILIGGHLTAYNGAAVHGLARLNTDGSLDTSLDSLSGGYDVTAIAVQPDGKILIGGTFLTYDDVPIPSIARLNSDGSLDPGFSYASEFNDEVISIVLQPDGKILVSGAFYTDQPSVHYNIERLNGNGSLDAGFERGSTAGEGLNPIALQPDGKILVGGWFTSYNGTAQNYLARLNADGTLDADFDMGMGPDFSVDAIALRPDGKIIIGGRFEFYDGIARTQLARLNSDGSLDTGFEADLDVSVGVGAITLQPDGKVLIGGWFANINDMYHRGFARLNSDGGLDTTFDPGSGASNNGAASIVLQTDGKILIGGDFDAYNGELQQYLARVLVEDDIGISEAISDPLFKVWPDPTFSTIHVPGMKEGYRWTIVDTQGRLLRQGSIAPDTEADIDVSSLASAGYLFLVQSGHDRRSARFSKW